MPPVPSCRGTRPSEAEKCRPLTKAAWAFSIICALVRPARAHSVRCKYCGSTLRTAGGLKQFGARSLGFQNSGSSKPAVQARSIKHVQPLVPLTATLYPVFVNTSTVARAETDDGPPVRAIAISIAPGMRYFSTGAIVGYEEVCCTCACADAHAPSKTTSARNANSFIYRA